ncbi:hypothetical protein FO488_15900 [Geobacter sp. FeAm09]|uniref:hypothetical protein n=1 Tax=Geobacter sp. FeAm09 TaxID=2597769 RepID=UPI0011EDF2B9|nr:hypothetical protein [Geobacter sp. FeAm09]QEM69491.1 hypothetical protein FO488_15900 [Geobacter sp. FeAm09]
MRKLFSAILTTLALALAGCGGGGSGGDPAAIQTANGQIAALQSQVAALQGQLSSAKNQADADQAGIGAAITSLQSTDSYLQKLAVGFLNLSSASTVSWSAKLAKLKTASDQVTVLQSVAAALAGDADDLGILTSAAVAQLTSQRNVVQGQVNTLTMQLAGANAANSQQAQQITDLTGQVNSVQGQLAATVAQVASLTTQLSQAQGDNSGLQSQLTAALAQVASLTSQANDLNSQVAGLNAQVASLNGQLTTAAATNTDLQNQLAAAQAQVTTLNGQIAALAGTGDSQAATIASLNDQITTLNQQLAAVTAIPAPMSLSATSAAPGVNITVTASMGAANSGKTITFSSSGGTLGSATVTANGSGTASTTFSASAAGTYNVYAVSGKYAAGAIVTVTAPAWVQSWRATLPAHAETAAVVATDGTNIYVLSGATPNLWLTSYTTAGVMNWQQQISGNSTVESGLFIAANGTGIYVSYHGTSNVLEEYSKSAGTLGFSVSLDVNPADSLFATNQGVWVTSATMGLLRTFEPLSGALLNSVSDNVRAAALGTDGNVYYLDKNSNLTRVNPTGYVATRVFNSGGPVQTNNQLIVGADTSGLWYTAQDAPAADTFLRRVDISTGTLGISLDITKVGWSYGNYVTSGNGANLGTTYLESNGGIARFSTITNPAGTGYGVAWICPYSNFTPATIRGMVTIVNVVYVVDVDTMNGVVHLTKITDLL